MIRRALLALTLLVAGVAVPATAGASTPAVAHAGLSTVAQDTYFHRLTVTGWAYLPAQPSATITVSVYVDGTWAGHAIANRYGRHAFRLERTWVKRAVRVSVVWQRTLTSAAVRHTWPSPGTRIVAVAKRYVGHARYVDGGASPRRGFDCSGYTSYVYAVAKVHRLPHNAEAQRHAHGMRLISRATARPGDLVFYLSGGTAYHVAIYAGHGMQYAAATPRDGIRYQHVWSSAVQYRTDWH